MKYHLYNSPMPLTLNTTIIGAGVIGLAIARQLSKKMPADQQILVIEKEPAFGRGISSRNSEVIHSGIYYPTNSQKHKLCIRGRRLLYDYCQAHRIPYQKCGKLIVAYQEQQVEALEKLYNHGLANQVEQMAMLTAKEVRQLEPDLEVAAAIHCQETGILDSHQYMQCLVHEIEGNNSIILYDAAVQNIVHHNDYYELVATNEESFYSTTIINAAGLGADNIAAMLNIEAPKIYPCKGNYFSYQGNHSFKHLVYPLPEKELTGLGIHATLDLSNRLKFGPDTEYINSREDFRVDQKRKSSFYEAARQLLPDLKTDQLQPDMAGIRPKLQAPGDKEVKDFYIKEEQPGFINLMGIESPGLTSALAIAEWIIDHYF